MVTTLLDAAKYHQTGSGNSLSRTLERRVGSTFCETNLADGYFTLPNTGTCSKRNLDTHSRIQPYPNDHGTSGSQAWHSATNNQLQRSLQFLEEFQRLIDYQESRGQVHRLLLYQQLINSIASQRVADRPDRFEPRLIETQTQALRLPQKTKTRHQK